MADINSNSSQNSNQSDYQGTILVRNLQNQGSDESNYLNQLDADRIYGINNGTYQNNRTTNQSQNKSNEFMAQNMMQNRNNEPTMTNQNYSTSMMSTNNAWRNTVDSGYLNDMGYDYSNLTNISPQGSNGLENLNDFLKTQIGRKITVDFFLGANTMVTKTGFLVGVASDYIVINEEDTSDITTCDFDNIKFIRFYY